MKAYTKTPCVSDPQGPQPMTRAEVLGARRGYEDALRNYAPWVNDAEIKRRAASMYPMPTKIVPREVETSTGTKYRVRNGRIEWKYRSSYNWNPTKYTPDDYALIATLKDNPTCEVEV